MGENGVDLVLEPCEILWIPEHKVPEMAQRGRDSISASYDCYNGDTFVNKCLTFWT